MIEEKLRELFLATKRRSDMFYVKLFGKISLIFSELGSTCVKLDDYFYKLHCRAYDRYYEKHVARRFKELNQEEK
jgi:hypothetical protein